MTEGYHATIFAYGQTGSGKTFTMEGYKYKRNQKDVLIPQINDDKLSEGIVPRSVKLLFDKVGTETIGRKFTVYCSFLQIYNEKIYDLLNKSHVKMLITEGPGLKLKWNKQDHFSVENLFTFECKSVDEVMQLFHYGIRNKVVSSHNMNNSSSRSHTILTLTIE